MTGSNQTGGVRLPVLQGVLPISAAQLPAEIVGGGFDLDAAWVEAERLSERDVRRGVGSSPRATTASCASACRIASRSAPNGPSIGNRFVSEPSQSASVTSPANSATNRGASGSLGPSSQASG